MRRVLLEPATGDVAVVPEGLSLLPLQKNSRDDLGPAD